MGGESSAAPRGSARRRANLPYFTRQRYGVLATSPGRLNPYKLGVELLRNVEERWNKGQFGKEWDECEDLATRQSWDRRLGLGRQKIFEVRALYNAAKAGHAGSLDPLASGLLPVCFGQATKVCGRLLSSGKTYRVLVQLGARTESGDGETPVIERAVVAPHDEVVDHPAHGPREPVLERHRGGVYHRCATLNHHPVHQGEDGCEQFPAPVQPDAITVSDDLEPRIAQINRVRSVSEILLGVCNPPNVLQVARDGQVEAVLGRPALMVGQKISEHRGCLQLCEVHERGARVACGTDAARRSGSRTRCRSAPELRNERTTSWW